MVVLVFREACVYCEANWKKWDTLVGGPSNSVPAVFISSDKTVSDAYRQKHPLLDKRISVIAMNPDVMSSMKLDATPQTLLVVRGVVKQAWLGVLSDSRLQEVIHALADEATQKL